MPTEQQILKEGLLNDSETPEETLEKLFQLSGWGGETGKAFVGVVYAAEDHPNGLYGSRVVSKEALSNWSYKVTRTHNGFLHIELLDFVAKKPANGSWYTQPKLC